MSKKQLLANILEALFLDRFLALLSRFLGNKLTVLAYHRVHNIPKEQYFFDYELVSANEEDFEFQVAYAKKYFNPISMAQLVNSLEGKEKLPNRPLLFTFDDGFDDNFLSAFPILKKYNVPATIFISTDYIGTSKTIWFDKLVAFILNHQSGELNIKELNASYQLDNNKLKRESIVFDILGRIKKVPNDVRIKILDRLLTKTSMPANNIDFSQSQMMSWEQVKSMSNDLVSFGSHTNSHPILTMLTSDELNEEISGSKLIIEEHLGVTVDSISYPNGGIDDFNEEVLNETKRSGYKVGFSYIGGVNPLPIVNKYKIKRLHVEYYVNKAYFKSLLCLPSIFSDA